MTMRIQFNAEFSSIRDLAKASNQLRCRPLSRLVHRFESGWERHQIKDLADTKVRRVKTT
jgi:hypothetical protein